MSVDAVSVHLGLDLGGTNLKWGVLELGGVARVVETGVLPTETHDGERGVLRQLIQVAQAACRKHGRIRSVGVGLPGVLDLAAGTTRFIPNIPGRWDGVPVAATLCEAVGVPARVINDARAFTLAEHRLGAGQGAETMLGITLGTGVGGGLILDGQLYLGHEGTAGEFGHQTVLPRGPACTCGNRGCLETLANAEAIQIRSGQPSPEKAVEAARAGDRRAQRAFNQVGRYLGIGVSNVVVLVGADRVVVGGGIAAAGEILLEPMRAELKKRVHVTEVERVRVVSATLGPWAGAIGAALYGAGSAGSMPLLGLRIE